MTAAVEIEHWIRRCGLDRGRDARHLRQRGLGDAEIGPDGRDRALEPADRRQLRVQPDRYAALRAEPGKGIRLLSGGELALQVLQLVVDVQDRLQQRRHAASYAGNRHLVLTAAAACPASA
jgi:hypothetical protein